MSQQDKSDPRLTEFFIPCAYCKHAIKIANPYGYSEHSTCTAFPQGIPFTIQTQKEKHDEVWPAQRDGSVYESKQVYNMPDGKNFVTWDGVWVETAEETKETK